MKGRHFRKCAFIALVLGMALLCGAAMAQSVGTMNELEEAVKAARGGDVITLTADIRSKSSELNSLVNTRGKEIVIDLGGHELYYPYFEQGTFTVRNGFLVCACLFGNGKALTVNLAEDVHCSGKNTVAGVVINNEKGGKIAFSNAGSIEGHFGIQLLFYKKNAIQVVNTGTVTADVYALELQTLDSGDAKVVNDGLLKSQCCAAVKLDNRSGKNTLTLNIEGKGSLVGACGIHAIGNTAVNADQRITATYTPEKNAAVLAEEENRRLIYQRQSVKITGNMIEEGDSLYEDMQAFASLRGEEENGVAVAIQNEDGDTNSLSLSGTLNATKRLLLLPDVLPYGPKAKVEVHSSVAPDSQADFFDVWLPLEKRPKEFTEAEVEKQLKAGMKRLDVEDFLAGGGRLRVCVSAPVLNAEGKMLISLSRNALLQDYMGGYLTDKGMEWVDGVAEEIYNQKMNVITDKKELAAAFEGAIAADGKYAVYLDSDVLIWDEELNGYQNFGAYRPKKGGRLYVEGNGHILQNGWIKADSPLILRNVTFENVSIVGESALEGCCFTNLELSAGKSSLVGVTAEKDNARLKIMDSDVEIGADCAMNQLSVTLWDKGTMTIVNNGNIAGQLYVHAEGGIINLSGEGHAGSIRLFDDSSRYKKKAAFKVEQDTDELEIQVDAKANVTYTGDVSGDINIEELKKGTSITLIGTVGGEVTVSFNADALGLEADGRAVENYTNACLKGLKLSKCKTTQNETPAVRLSEYGAMHIRTDEFSEDYLSLEANIVNYDISYDGEKIVCSGRTHTTQKWERSEEHGEWGDPVYETVVRYDAEGNVAD
ncbi:MAG: hypothetical protein MRZ54_01040 [Clostridiales bacterium]|nr:hypothetical protein [Clostridiales bacterium]